MYYLLSHQHQYLKRCCTMQDLLCFGLFLMLRSSSTLFSIINPFTEGDAVLSLSNLTINGKKKHCLHFYFFPTVCCQKNCNWRLPSYEPLCVWTGVWCSWERKCFLTILHEISTFLLARHSHTLSSKQSNKERKPSFSCCTHWRELWVWVDPDVTVNEVGGEVGSIDHRKNNPRLSEHHTAGCHIGCCSQAASCFPIWNLMLGTEISSPSSLHFSSQTEYPWEGVVPLG